MKRNIRLLEVINGNFSRQYVIGMTVVGGTKHGKKVAKIRDVSQEYEDHVFSSYLIEDEDGSVLTRIENCPVLVEYDTQQEA